MDFPEPWNNIGVLLGRQGRYGAAKQAFLKVLKIDPSNREALANISVAYYFLNDYEKLGKYAKIARELGVILPGFLSFPLKDEKKSVKISR